ncbi:unnamed protein product [Staurois parvus]|uniref:Uncharacterized protein n=1 Tax=Staurois parvus TaxID=386267 RepID=A0ABN9F177_9NEOB|nr:unnamed protein product [Staurois parvus]
MGIYRWHRLALMVDIERQLRWALICGIDVHWYALIRGIYVELMGTGKWD